MSVAFPSLHFLIGEDVPRIKTRLYTSPFLWHTFFSTSQHSESHICLFPPFSWYPFILPLSSIYLGYQVIVLFRLKSNKNSQRKIVTISISTASWPSFLLYLLAIRQTGIYIFQRGKNRRGRHGFPGGG